MVEVTPNIAAPQTATANMTGRDTPIALRDRKANADLHFFQFISGSFLSFCFRVAVRTTHKQKRPAPDLSSDGLRSFRSANEIELLCQTHLRSDYLNCCRQSVLYPHLFQLSELHICAIPDQRFPEGVQRSGWPPLVHDAHQPILTHGCRSGTCCSSSLVPRFCYGC